MSDYICFLLRLLVGEDLIDVAIKINRNKIPEYAGDVPDYPMEPENLKYIHSLLPKYYENCKILRVDSLDDIL